MPPDELFEWEAFLRYEDEERKKEEDKPTSNGKGKRRQRF